MTKREIIRALTKRYQIQELQSDIKDLKSDARMVKTKPLLAVIKNSIRAKEIKIERLKREIKELEA